MAEVVGEGGELCGQRGGEPGGGGRGVAAEEGLGPARDLPDSDQYSTAQYSIVQYSTVQTCLIAAARLWSPEGTPADSTLSDTLNNNTWRRCGYDCTAAVWSVECGPCEVVRSSAVSASSCPDQWLESAASTRKVIICTTELRSLLYEWPPPEAESPNIFMIV